MVRLSKVSWAIKLVKPNIDFEEWEALTQKVIDMCSPDMLSELERLPPADEKFQDIVRALLQDIEKGGQNLKPSKPSVPPNDDNEVIATHKAWSTPFEGAAADRLLEAIRWGRKEDVQGPYSSFFSIIQSSGMGKSRTVDEVAKRIFTLPFNIRGEARGNISFPLPDDNVRDHFDRFNTQQTRHETSGDFLLFFAKVFEVVNEEIGKLELDNPGPSLPELWRSHLKAKRGTQTIRQILYGEAIARVQNSYDGVVKEANRLESTSERSPEADAGLKASWFREAASIEARQSLEELKSAICPGDADMNTPTILMYFDESHTLFRRECTVDLDNHPSTFFDALCSALNALEDRKLFSVFLSTNSSLERHAPRWQTLPSARGTRPEFHAPFVELSFDCHPSFPLYKDLNVSNADQPLTLERICSLEFMCTFGRPLFWTRYRYGQTSVRNTIIKFAEEKLLCNPVDAAYFMNVDESSKWGKLEDDTPLKLVRSVAAHLAILDLRVLLDFQPRRDAFSVESQLVESHMRVVYSVPAHRTYCTSGYPSEPILAEAAARLMSKLRENGDDSDPIPMILRNYVSNGLISKGERGELVARLLLIQAMDAAQEKTRRTSEVRFSQPISVAEFLQALLGADNWNIIKTSKPDNIPSKKTFEEAFRYAKVRFTHFNRAGDDSGCTDLAAMAAFLRAMGIQCHSSKEGIDIILPIFFVQEPGKSVHNVLPEYISGILVSIKHRQRASSHAKVGVDATRIGFFRPSPTTTPNTQPYIVLVMELGVRGPIPTSKSTYLFDSKKADQGVPQKRDRSNTGQANVEAKSKKSKKDRSDNATPDVKMSSPEVSDSGDQPTFTKVDVSEPRRFSSRRNSPTHPRYTIYVYGCSGSVYPVIKQQEIYSHLLGSWKVLDEHPRPQFIGAVKSLKPAWSAGNDCYKWFGFGDMVDEEEQLEEGVTIGEAVDADEDDDVFV